MKPTINPGLMLVLLLSLLCSCYSSKDLSKNKTITQDLLSSLQPGTRYVLELKIGQIQTIYITSVEGQRLTGYLYPNGYNKKNKIAYDESFENIVKYVTKISERKINPAKTTVAILVPAAVIIPMVIVILDGGLVSMTF